MTNAAPNLPPLRLSAVNAATVRPDGDYVLYWMIAARRTRWSFALQHALRRAAELGRPLLVLEALRCGHRWASERIHRFVLDGMADNAAAFSGTAATYYAYVEPAHGAGKGLLEALAARACLVVTDEFPCFFLPRMVAAAGADLTVRLEQVDGNGILPLRANDKEHSAAVHFRRAFQRCAAPHLEAAPLADPLRLAPGQPPPGLVPAAITSRWPSATPALLAAQGAAGLEVLPIDHTVAPVSYRGGAAAASERLAAFLGSAYPRYGEERSHPDRGASSQLSPYLHFGHIGVHEVVAAVWERESWRPGMQSGAASGSRAGWWNLSPTGESFLDELIVWRELGYGFCHHRPQDYDRYESLPAWAQETLAEHEADPREAIYDVEALARAETADPVWNAAQRELVRDGRMHNYLRMLWGKRVLEWSETPQAALDKLIELNNRYALDGRNPNSYSGIFWTLGRFDRPWGPERPIFGKVRYMTSANTLRKLQMRDYLAEFGGADGPPTGAAQGSLPLG